MFSSNIFKERLKKRREELGITQEDFAKMVGMARASASYYENVKNASLPNIEVFHKMCEVLEVSPQYLMGTTEIKSIDMEIKDISEKLGLSENNIKKFLNPREYFIDGNEIVALDYLLSLEPVGKWFMYNLALYLTLHYEENKNNPDSNAFTYYYRPGLGRSLSVEGLPERVHLDGLVKNIEEARLKFQADEIMTDKFIAYPTNVEWPKDNANEE